MDHNEYEIARVKYNINYIMKTKCSAIFLVAVWISISEFFRNQFLLSDLWVSHYKSMGLIFPATSTSGMIWGVWSLGFAVFIFFIFQKYIKIIIYQ